MSASWDDIVKDWEKIPIEAYELLFNQAKDRFDDVSSESVSITEKSINLTKLAVLAISGFVGYNFKINPGAGWIVFLTFIFLIDMFLLVKLMFPKGVIFKGSPPKEMFRDYLDNPNYTQDEKVLIVYYHELRRYQESIDKMNRKNEQRQWYYGSALIFTALLTILAAGAIISTIF
jgi:hypothetical protein